MQLHVNGTTFRLKLRVVALTVVCLGSLPSTGITYEGLQFFKAGAGRGLAAGDSLKYDLVTDVLRGNKYSVERSPTVRIPVNEVKTILLEKQPILAEASNPAGNLNYVYMATFILLPEGVRKIRTLTSGSVGRRFAFSSGNQRLAIVVIHEPIEGDEFTTYLDEANEARLRSIFSSFGSKVVWPKPGMRKLDLP